MTRDEIALNNLARRSRAYNALYGIGAATPGTVPTLTDKETDRILQVAAEAASGEGHGEMHEKMRRMAPGLLEYVANGGVR